MRKVMGVMLVMCVMGCESKNKVVEQDAGASMTVDAGQEQVPDVGAAAEDMAVDMVLGDRPLKLELDRNLFPATKSGVMPNIRFDGGGDGGLKLQVGQGKGGGLKIEQQDDKP